MRLPDAAKHKRLRGKDMVVEVVAVVSLVPRNDLQLSVHSSGNRAVLESKGGASALTPALLLTKVTAPSVHPTCAGLAGEFFFLGAKLTTKLSDCTVSGVDLTKLVPVANGTDAINLLPGGALTFL